MSHYYNISFAEMRDFLEPQGFQPVNIPNTTEYVFGKRVYSDRVTLPLSLRIYTGINRDGESREVGADAIRVVIFARRPDDQIVKLAGSKRVHRVDGWRKNLQDRIDAFVTNFIPGDLCPRCKLPLCERKGRFGKFLGCLMYPSCTFTQEVRESNKKRKRK